MRLEYQIQKGKPYPLGVSLTKNGIHIVVPMECKNSCGIILYIKKKEIRITFPKEYAIGNLYTIQINGIDAAEAGYRLFCDELLFVDAYCRQVEGRSKWGSCHKDDSLLVGRLTRDTFEWDNDSMLQIPFHESILYHAHVRGFTKHPSAKVVEKGTFLGATRKIPHLKELGITGICFMPFYEFDEVIRNPVFCDMDEAVTPFMDEEKMTWKYKINYWGFAQKAFYFAPKASYAYTKNAPEECKAMVKAFHQAGIEVLMQVYFPKHISEAFIYHVIRFWVEEYHIDGFLIQGDCIPQKLLKQDDMLSKTKLIFERYVQTDEDKLYEEEAKYKNSAYLNFNFMYDARKFLKGDSDMLHKMSVHLRNNPKDCASINQITAYNGFTLMDLVSYNRKHNEANGEENRDGNDYNYSWNCGFEGPTRKKSVQTLRNKQYRNAICLLLFAQATPMLLAGDEFGNSNMGNNNAYCQDNATNWLNWNDLEKRQDIFCFVKAMIRLRMEHPILHRQDAMRIMDYIGCGYPDLSYHGEQAWYVNLANYNHHIGVLYCGKYARKERDKEDDFIYVLYNMYWEENDFALPKLPAGMKWQIVTDTSKEPVNNIDVCVKHDTQKQLKVTLPPRCIWILMSTAE